MKKIIQKIVGQGSPDLSRFLHRDSSIGALCLPPSSGVAALVPSAGRRKPLFKGISLSPQLEGGYSRENHRYTVVSGWKDQQHKNSTFPTFHRSSSCSGSAPATRSRVVYGVAPAPAVSVPVHQNSNTPSLHVPSTPNRGPSSTAGKSTVADSPLFSGIALPPRLVGENKGENHAYTIVSPWYDLTQNDGMPVILLGWVSPRDVARTTQNGGKPQQRDGTRKEGSGIKHEIRNSKSENREPRTVNRER
jgi:hypothetical protein